MFKTFFISSSVSAIILGIFLSDFPRNMGLYRWMTTVEPMLIGLTPAFHNGNDGYSTEKLYNTDLTGQSAFVTGANSGIGYEITRALSRLGASVTMACRDPLKCEESAKLIRNHPASKGQIKTTTMDVSSLKSVKECAEKFLESNEKLDMLFLNAGIYSVGLTTDGKLPLSADGIEKVFATNVVGHHLLYTLLEPLLRNAPSARVISVSSASSYFELQDKKMKIPTDLQTLNNFKPTLFNQGHSQVYAQSKLAQVYWTQELTERLGNESTIYANAVHPGMVHTSIQSKVVEALKLPDFVMQLMDLVQLHVIWTAEEGALTPLYLGVASDEIVPKKIRGRYFHPIAQEISHPYATDKELQAKVWSFLEELTLNYTTVSK